MPQSPLLAKLNRHYLVKGDGTEQPENGRYGTGRRILILFSAITFLRAKGSQKS